MRSGASTGAFASALKVRKRKDRRRLLTRIGVIFGMVLVIALLMWLAFFSSVFRVNEVTVQGIDLVSEEAVLAAAQVPQEAQMVSLDVEAIALRVRELPEIRDVAVNRELPGTLSIVVTERTLVYLRVKEEEYQFVDEDGVIFSTSAEPVEDVVLAVTSGEETRVLADVAEVVSHIPADLLPRVQSVQAKAVDRITLELDEGGLVVWGSAEQSELKADVLEALMASVQAQRYDVSAPSHPTTK